MQILRKLLGHADRIVDGAQEHGARVATQLLAASGDADRAVEVEPNTRTIFTHWQAFVDRWGLRQIQPCTFDGGFPAYLVRDCDESGGLKAKPGRITKLLKDHRIRRLDAEAILSHLRGTPVYSAPGTATAAIAHLELLAERARLINKQIKACKARLEALLEEMATEPPAGQKNEQRDVTIIQTMPGIGVIVASTLLGEAAGPLQARDYPALRALSGIAPVTRRSGKKKSVVMRTACHPRLRNAVYHWARVATQNDDIAKARYSALRARGKSHGHALRSVADRLLGVLCAMLRNQTDYRKPEATAAA